MKKTISEADAAEHRKSEKRMRDVILFTLGTLQEMTDMGLVQATEGAAGLTPAGMTMFFKMKADGFHFDPHECEWAMTMFRRYSTEEDSVAEAIPS